MLKQRLSDNSFVTASKRFVAPADGTAEALWIPRGHLIEEVWAEVVEAASEGTATVTVGITGDDLDCFLEASALDGVTDGFCYSSKGQSGGVRGGGYYTQGGTSISYTAAIGTSATQGTFVVYARYTKITR